MRVTIYFAGDISAGLRDRHYTVDDFYDRALDEGDERERVRDILGQAFAAIEGESCRVVFEDEEQEYHRATYGPSIEDASTVMVQVVVQRWEESERGWGVRPDGYSVHLTRADCETFITEYWRSMPNQIPDEYSRPEGEPYCVDVIEALYDRVKKSKNGVRVNSDFLKTRNQ